MLETRHSAPAGPSWACFPAADPHKIPIDPNGNLSTKTEGSDTWAYEWDAENQLKRVTKNAAEVARFAYDPAGRRVEKIAGSIATGYTYYGDNILREVRGTTSLRYVHGPGLDAPLQSDDGTAVGYFHADGLGSITEVTDAAGAVTLTRRYDAWGRLDVSAAEQGFAFTGREWDPEANLYYYRARYYDPSTARFASEDPIPVAKRTPRESNGYSYVANSPVTGTDPFGLKTVWLCKVPLHVMGGSGQRSGPDMAGNPLYHEYYCLIAGGKCCGQDRSGNPFLSRGKAPNDTWGPRNCQPVEVNPCQWNCLADACDAPRPWYSTFLWGATDCQEWVEDQMNRCRKNCCK